MCNRNGIKLAKFVKAFCKIQTFFHFYNELIIHMTMPCTERLDIVYTFSVFSGSNTAAISLS